MKLKDLSLVRNRVLVFYDDVDMGQNTVAIANDVPCQQFMAYLKNDRGENAGVYEYLVPNDGVTKTRDEALVIAAMHLTKRNEVIEDD